MNGQVINGFYKTLGVMLFAAVTGITSQVGSSEMTLDRCSVAQRYFRAVYSGDVDVLDELAAVDIVISYHLFVDILGAPTRRGREAAREFVTRFAKKWIEPTVTFHECIVEGDRVVLIWSFSAESSSSVTADDPAREDIHRWGGITLIRFDKDGHVVAEIGQESTPGPMARIAEVEP